MRSFILLSLLATFLFSCSSDSQEAKDKQHVKIKSKVEKVSKPQKLTLHVYNMGGVPAKDVDELVNNICRFIEDDSKEQMGINARRYYEKYFERRGFMDSIEHKLIKTVESGV